MKYQIVKEPNYTNAINVGIITEPDCPCLKFFLSSLKLEIFPKYISDLSKSIDFGGNEFTLLRFYKNMDWEDTQDINIESGDIYIYNTILKCECIMKEAEFDNFFYDYSLVLIEMNSNDYNLPDSWVIECKREISFLKEKIRNSPKNI